MRARFLIGPWITLALSLVVRGAGAEPLPAPPPEAGAPVKAPDTTVTTAATPDQANVETDQAKTSYWSQGLDRGFVAATVDGGYLYLRPRVSFGYGKPFSRWVGVDVNPIASSRYLGGYGGLRATLPFVDLRVGGRYVWAFQQSYLAPLDHYHRLDIESQALVRSQYLSLEAELTASLPVGPGSVIATASGSLLTGALAGTFVYDETLRVIVKPPAVWRGRLGYVVRFGQDGKLSLGVVGDLLGLPGRDAYVIRAGLIGSAVLSDHIEVLASFVPPIVSPDTIGILGGDFAQLGVRYRWATGSGPARVVGMLPYTTEDW